MITSEQKKEIILAMADCNLNIQAVKHKLFIHRNTVIYRLEKIKSETGLDARNFHDLVKLIDMINGGAYL